MSQRSTDGHGNNGTGRTALVSGGNSGIGFAIAKGLGKKGYKVWIAGRSAEKGAAAAAQLGPFCPAGVEFLPVDLTLFGRIEEFVRTLRPRLAGRLDALVHTTGVNNLKRIVSADGLEEGWATQFLGRYLLTEAFTPELSNSADGRVVLVRGQVPKVPHLFEDDVSLASNYSVMRSIEQSQSACSLYEQMYAAEHPNGPALNAGVAGLVRDTGIFRSQPGALKATMTALSVAIGMTPEQAAASFIALASDPALKGVSGYFFPQPRRLEKRVKLAFDRDQIEALRRVLDQYAAIRKTLLAA